MAVDVDVNVDVAVAVAVAVIVAVGTTVMIALVAWTVDGPANRIIDDVISLV